MPNLVPLFETSGSYFNYMVKAVEEIANSDEYKRVLFRVVDGGVVCAAIGGGLFLTMGVPAETQKKGDFVTTIPSLKLASVGAVSKHGEITIKGYFNALKGGDQIVLKFNTDYTGGTSVINRRTVKLHSLDFAPQIPPLPQVDPIQITSDKIVKSVGEVYTLSPDSDANNMAVRGVNVEFKKNRIVASATDSVCIAKKELSYMLDTEFSCVFPFKFSRKLIGLAKYTEEFKFYHTGRTLFAKGNSFILGTALHKCAFPDYSKVFANKGNFCIVVDSVVMQDSLDKLLPAVGQDPYKKITVVIDVDDSLINMWASDYSVGAIPFEIKKKMAVKTFTFDINGQLFKTLIGNTKTKGVKLYFLDPEKPIFIEPLGADDYTSIMVPLRKGVGA